MSTETKQGTEGLEFVKKDRIDGYAQLIEIIIEDRQRKEFSDMQGLAASIKEFDVIQPIVLMPVSIPEKPGKKFRLIAGERRFRASVMAGKKTIPYVLRENLDIIQLKEIELEENLRRSNLSMMEEANALLELHELKRSKYGDAVSTAKEETGIDAKDGWNLAKTAQVAQSKLSTVARKIKLAKDLKQNPELKAQVENLPLAAAARKIQQLKQVKKVEGQHERGEIKLSTEIKKGDCRVLIKELPNESVNLVITDPPFGLDDIEDARVKGGQGETQNYTAQLAPEDNSTLDQAVQLIDDMAPEFFRVLKPGSHIYIFCSTTYAPFIYKALEKAGFECQQSLLIWDKERTTVPSRGYEYASSYEPIIYGWKPPRSKFLESPSSNILRFSPLHASKKLHPFEKPGKLIRFLIKQSSIIGDVVLDAFCGSGRTPLEAKRMNRSAIGFELNNQHYLQAQARLMVPTLMEPEDKD